jgi:hypothetical protein
LTKRSWILKNSTLLTDLKPNLAHSSSGGLPVHHHLDKNGFAPYNFLHAIWKKNWKKNFAWRAKRRETLLRLSLRFKGPFNNLKFYYIPCGRNEEEEKGYNNFRSCLVYNSH